MTAAEPAARAEPASQEPTTEAEPRTPAPARVEPPRQAAAPVERPEPEAVATVDETPLPPAEGAPGTAADPLASTVEPSPQLPDPNLRYAYDQVDRAPVPLSTQLPAYTPERPGRGSEGSLELDVLVGADGHIAAVRVARGIDDAALRRSAVSAILRWRFAPGSHRGVEVPVWVPVRLEFSRSGDEMRGVVKLAH